MVVNDFSSSSKRFQILNIVYNIIGFAVYSLYVTFTLVGPIDEQNGTLGKTN